MLDARVKVTHDFVKSNCRLVMPNISFAQYAQLVKTFALEFEEAKSTNGHKGLSPEVDKQTQIDENFEDRMIISEVTAFSLLGKKNIKLLTCGRSRMKVRRNDQEVVSLGKKYRQCQVVYGSSLPEFRGGEDMISVFMHSNHNDFGDSLRDSDDVRQVSFKVKEIIEKVLSNGARMSVLTPNEIEKTGL